MVYSKQSESDWTSEMDWKHQTYMNCCTRMAAQQTSRKAGSVGALYIIIAALSTYSTNLSSRVTKALRFVRVNSMRIHQSNLPPMCECNHNVCHPSKMPTVIYKAYSFGSKSSNSVSSQTGCAPFVNGTPALKARTSLMTTASCFLPSLFGAV